MKRELGMYELVLLFKYNSTEKTISEKIEFYKEFLTQKGSQVMAKNCGKKSLAYMIKGFDSAVSVQLVFLGNGNLLKLLNTEIQRDECVLRAVTTKLVDQQFKLSA
tara:strand:- start:151 stop:468 length:318 start_codon:yes stop_codon:yes gene_type:complete